MRPVDLRNGLWMIAGSVSREAEAKTVSTKNGEKIVCKFSIYCGKDQNGQNSYCSCVAWDELGAALSELRSGDAFFGFARKEEREWGGKHYTDWVLEFGSSPMISAGAAPSEERPHSAAPQQSAPRPAGNAVEISADGWSEPDEVSGELPF